MGLTIRMIFCFFLLTLNLASYALPPAFIKGGIGVFLYDAYQANGPTSPIQKDHVGQWTADIQTYQQGALPKNLITRIYTYSGALSTTCTDISNCIYSGPNKNVEVGYDPSDFGPSSVAAYRAAFPNMLILAIIDADAAPADFPLLSNPTFGTAVANQLTTEICADINVDGVVLDLEPFNFLPNQGQFSLYRQIAINFASPQCIDQKHPNGRVFGIFMNPNKVSDWTVVSGMLGNTGVLIVDAYDIIDNAPPPVNNNLYLSSITGKIGTFMNPNSIQYKIPYTVALAASASYSAFDEIGTYDSSAPAPYYFKLTQDFGPDITQYKYVHTILGMLQQQATSGLYQGQDLWRWAQYTAPQKNSNTLLMPTIPRADVITLLQNQ